MRRLNILLLISLVLMCLACDDFLAKTPSDEVTPESTQAFSELLLYEGYLPNSQGVNRMLYYMDDDVENNYPTSTYSSGYRDADIENKLFYTWQPGAVNDVINNTAGNTYSATKGVLPWQAHFKCILGCNIILVYADESVGSEIDKNYLKGEAYCLRAFHYFQLVNLYGWPYNDEKNDPKVSLGVPIVTEPEIGALSLTRSTVEQVYSLIVEDIENSIRYFDKGKKESTKYRVSSLTAHLLASRIYLYMENWEKALEHARVVMGQKELCDYTQGVPTAIFTAENDDILWMYGTKDNVWGIGDANLSSSAFVASYSLYESFESEEWKDARADGFFSVARDSVFDSYYDYETGQVIKELISSSVMVSVLKYPTSTSAYTQGVRVTEAYLNAIEALLGQYKAGNSGAGNEALQLLNDFRSKRYVSAGGTAIPGIEMKNADELIDIYRLERRKELCYEGQRWFDLRRFGMPRLEKIWALDGNAREKYVLEKHDPLYVLEIPAYVTDLNSGLQLTETLSSPRLPVSL